VIAKRILHRDHASVVVGQDGRYRLIRLIGEDGLGKLWHGEDTPLQAPVTIRIVRESLTRDQGRVDALHQQLNALYPRLAHPNIASVYYYNYGQDGRLEFVVMEELRGETLAHRLERGAEFRPRESFAIGAQIAEGLQAAHDLGFAHAALTSHSVMLIDDRSVKIMDFGLAALRPNAEERPGFKGPADDILALGALLREMSGSRSGGRPAGDPASGETIGAELARLWRASMDPDPATRPTAEAFTWALRETAEPHPVRRVRSVEGADTALRLDEAEGLDGEEEDTWQDKEELEAEEVRQAEERRAKQVAQAEEALPREESRSTEDALRSIARSRARPRSGAPPSALPKRAERRRSAIGLLPRGRRWLWLAGLALVTAFLVFLLARPDAERAGNQTPPTAPQNETGSESIVMPDLRGLSYARALSRLQEEGLVLARRVKTQGDPGVVVATDPSLGHRVSTGTRVTIFLGVA
jgi:hypothetical protein